MNASTPPEPFEQRDEVRAVDLDRGFMRLGKRPGIICYVRPDQLEEVARVGVEVNVRGKHYRPCVVSLAYSLMRWSYSPAWTTSALVDGATLAAQRM